MCTRTPLLVLLLGLLVVPIVAQESRPAARAITATDLEPHLTALCSKEQAGRFGAGAALSRDYLARRFRDLGLEPIRGESYELPFALGGLKGTNLAGRLVAKAARKREGYLILSAHYDHLGARGGVWFPGACDNASGVAAMLEIAARIDPARLERDLVLVAFDLEERGLLGSSAWCEEPPLALEDCRLFITMDMLGRQGLGVVDGLLFAQGWEWTPEILGGSEAADAAEEAVELSYFWTDIAGDRSDFAPFKRKRVPHLFFGTGENEDYHQPSDRPDRLDLPLLARQAELVRAFLVAEAARVDALDYRQEPLRHLIEFRSLEHLANELYASKSPRMDRKSRFSALLLSGIAARVVKSGAVKESDRGFLKRVARRLQQEMR